MLALEFSPVVFEALGWKVPLKIIRAITIPLIIAGVTLSTMHQSTLGTMLTILPYNIHPLWYSPLLPLYFYLTAIAAGLAMTVFESYHSARTYGFPFEIKMLSSLVKAHSLGAGHCTWCCAWANCSLPANISTCCRAARRP